MPAANLEATVKRYNEFVERGVDEDFDKPKPQFRIATPPFYAAWATFTVHDTYAGLRINMKCQVMDMKGEVIPGLYCGGESAAGCSQHGMGRALTQGYIAGSEAAAELAVAMLRASIWAASGFATGLCSHPWAAASLARVDRCRAMRPFTARDRRPASG